MNLTIPYLRADFLGPFVDLRGKVEQVTDLGIDAAGRFQLPLPVGACLTELLRLSLKRLCAELLTGGSRLTGH